MPDLINQLASLRTKLLRVERAIPDMPQHCRDFAIIEIRMAEDRIDFILDELEEENQIND